MWSQWITIILLIATVISNLSCSNKVENKNRVPFEIEPLTNVMQLSVCINDTATAKMTFDTGLSMICFDLDSAFCESHPMALWEKEHQYFADNSGSAWTNKRPTGLMKIYDEVPITIGDITINYEKLRVSDLKSYFSSTDNGIFGLSRTDSTHIWEVNFENNYLELHNTDNYRMPDSCMLFPLSEDSYGFLYVTMPLSVQCSDGSTLTLNRKFLVDTGASWDVTITPNSEEFSFFQGKDGVPFYFNDSYVNRHIVKADIGNDFHIDSLRVYMLNDAARLPAKYIIGLNFLKRFNVFFDMKNRQLGLLPLKEFHRVTNPNMRKFHIGILRTDKGTIIVDEIAEHKNNYYTSAGIRLGDEITAINGVKLYKNMPAEEEKRLFQNQQLVFDVERNDKLLKITVNRDPNEQHGD